MTAALDEIAPTTNARVVVATVDGVYLPGSGTGRLHGGHIDAVVVAGEDLWILKDQRQLHRVSLAAPARSELVATIESGAATCLGLHRGTVWAGGENARLWRLDASELVPVESFAEAPTHEDWHTPWGGPPAAFSIASTGNDLYVSVHVGGIMHTSDDGASWSPTIDLHTDVHQVALGAGGHLWAATGERGLGESDDHGASWRFQTDGLHAHYLLAVAATRQGAVVGASSGHRGRDGAVYRYDGSCFERCQGGLPNRLGGAVAPRHLVASGDLVAVATPGGDVYSSGDGGRTWSLVVEGLPAITEVSLADLL
jgi:hypothetical protein